MARDPATPLSDSTAWPRRTSYINVPETELELEEEREDMQKDADVPERVPFLGADSRRAEVVDTQADVEEDGVKTVAADGLSWRKPSIHWLAPFALSAAICRGMTLAPRVEVYTALTCYALSPDAFDNTSLQARSFSPPHHLFYLPLDDHSLGPRLPAEIELPSDPTAFPEPSKACSSNPHVQSAAARLQTAITISMGILSALTTPLWGSLSDTYGRTRILALAALGLLATDVVFILVCHYRANLSRWMLVLGPAVEGALGGWTTMQAAINAYASDVTDKESRAKIFSRFFGLIYIGVALGPTISGQLIKHTRSLTSVFYLSALSWLVIALCMLLLLPEALSPSARSHSKGKRGEEGTRKWWQVAEPLSVFWPRRRRSGRRDWNLTFVGGASFSMLLVYGIYHMKFQYAIFVYAWGAEELGYYLAYIGSARAIHLLLLLPALIRLIRPPPSPSLSAHALSAKTDHRLARLSIALDVLAYSLTSLSPPGFMWGFVLFTSMSSFAGGALPAMHSLALGALTAQEAEAAGEPLGGVGDGHETNHAGRLFGAFGLVQAMSSMLLGPLMFGAVYSVTVYTFPKTIFVLAACLLAIALSCICAVHVAGIEREDEEVREGT